MASHFRPATLCKSDTQLTSKGDQNNQEKHMKWLFLLVVLMACVMLGAAMVFIDIGILRDSVVCGLGALFGFLLGYQMQARYSVLDDD